MGWETCGVPVGKAGEEIIELHPITNKARSNNGIHIVQDGHPLRHLQPPFTKRIHDLAVLEKLGAGHGKDIESKKVQGPGGGNP